MKRSTKIVCCIAVIVIVIFGCMLANLNNKRPPEATPSRAEKIPASAIKMSPSTDNFKPILNSDEFETPVPMAGPINTAGAEDSPFITPDGNTFYFFFTPDVNVPPQKQLTDKVTGIWWCKKINGTWSEPEKIRLCDDVSLDGAAFVMGDKMWFGSVRAGNYGEVDIYTAELKNGKWTNVKNAGKQLNKEYDIGELHISPDGQTLYCGDSRTWNGSANKDLFTLQRSGDSWSAPIALPYPINTNEYNEDQPFVSSNGTELWFTGQSRLGRTGPAVFRCIKESNGTWGAPVEMVSNFAGEPTLDDEGNLYFVHHYFSKDMSMIEADIYVAMRK